jgi:hypothetical protein
MINVLDSKEYRSPPPRDNIISTQSKMPFLQSKSIPVDPSEYGSNLIVEHTDANGILF